MEPVVAERFTGSGFGLGDFAFVVRKSEVFATAVEVYSVAEIFLGHD